MQKDIDEEILKICAEIAAINKSDDEWKKIESGDMFQTKHYCGGFEADENAFLFSYYGDDNNEYYLRLSLKDINDILDKKKNSITMSHPS